MKKATTEKSDKDVHRIVQCYDTSLKKFRFGKHLAEISVFDVHYILGLPMSGLTVPNPKDGSRKPTDNPIVQRFFAEEKRIERGKIMSCVDAELDNEESPERIENIAILMILHMFITQLFASAGSKLGWSFVKCITDIETMNKYNWAKGVRDYLLFCLNTAKNGQAIQISGCMTLISICERNALLKEINGREEMIPSCRKKKKHLCSKKNSDDDFEDTRLKIQPKKRKMEVQKEKVGVAVRRNKIEKKAKVTAKKSNKNKKQDAAEEVQEDVADYFMEIATEQVQEGVIVLFQEGATEQVQEKTKYLTLEDWVCTEEIENQHAKVDGNGKEIVEFNFENGERAKGNVDEFDDAIYEQNAA
ncbi:hypothetical protein ACLB2K_039873 [Fragaria x ananassa]